MKMKNGLVRRGEKWHWCAPNRRDAKTGKYPQKWGHADTWDAAKNARADFIKSLKDGTYIEPSDMTLIAWMTKWLDTLVKPLKRLNTYETYKQQVERTIKPAAIANIPLQRLRMVDLTD